MDLQQIEKQIAELSAKLEDLKKQAEEKDFPKSINQLLDQDRYHVGCDGEIEKILPGRPDFDDLPTRQHAVSQRAASQLMNLIYHINGGQIVEMGVSVGYNKIDGFFVAATVNVVNPFVKFKNIELARRSIELHRRLWMEYFTGQEQPEE